MSRADHTGSQLLPVRARVAVCTRACGSVHKRVPECARAATGPPGWAFGALATPGFLRPGAGARTPRGCGPTRAVRKACSAALCVAVCGSAPPAGTIFCFARDRHIKGKAAAARHRPLSLRCPLLQVYYYSTGRAASPRGLAACRAVQRPGRLHAWRAPKPPPPPPYLSEKQPHVEAEKPAGGGRGRAGVCVCAPCSGAGPGRRDGLRGPLCPPGARRAQWGRRGAPGAWGAGARACWPLADGAPESPIPAE